MNSNLSDPNKRRVYSPNQKYWVDIIEHGEIAMSAEQREFETSFDVDDTRSFVLVNAQCCFLDDDRFLLYDSNTVILNYIQDNQCMHLSREDVGEDCFWIDVDLQNISDPDLIFKRREKQDERVKLSKCLGLFSPGRSAISKYLK